MGNINKIIERSLAIEAREAKDAGALGYMGRSLVQATMPHKKVDGNEFKRENGAFSLTMLSPSEIGLPYGSIPRLLMAWITTEVVQKKERKISLGRSLNDFMSQLGMLPTGGRWGSITRLKDQMTRLFSCSISASYADKSQLSGLNMQVVEECNLWWGPLGADQTTIWESTITLNQRFFDELISNPIPLDVDALRALKKSPMAIDIYCWLTYRVSYLNKKTTIPWSALKSQFGANYRDGSQGDRNFKRRFLKALLKVSCIYPELNIEKGRVGIILRPSSTHISMKS